MATKAKQTKKAVKAVKEPKAASVPKEKAVKIPLYMIPNVIDQAIHINQTPEQMVPPKAKRGPKMKREVVITPDGRKIGPVHPVRSGFGEPVGMLVGKRVDFAKEGTVLTLEAQKDGAEVAYSKVYIGASRVNLNAGDEFNAAEGRALCLAQIEEMVAGKVNQVAESLIPYIRPFRDRCIRYFTRKHARAPIDVVTPIGRTFAQKVSYEAKQFAIRLAKFEKAQRQFMVEVAKQHLGPEELAQKEEEFLSIWLTKMEKAEKNGQKIYNPFSEKQPVPAS